MDSKAGTPAKVEITRGGRDGIVGYFIAADATDMSVERFQRFENRKQGTIKAGTLEGTKYFYEQTVPPEEGVGLQKGAKQYAYYFVKDGKGIYLSYSVNPDQTNNIELVEKSIQTLR